MDTEIRTRLNAHSHAREFSLCVDYFTKKTYYLEIFYSIIVTFILLTLVLCIVNNVVKYLIYLFFIGFIKGNMCLRLLHLLSRFIKMEKYVVNYRLYFSLQQFQVQ